MDNRFNGMKNRSRTDILAMILESSMEGSHKTQLMLHVKLSYYQLEEYLDIGMKSGLLTFEKLGKFYKTTGKGKEFQQLYYKMNNLLHKEIVALEDTQLGIITTTNFFS